MAKPPLPLLLPICLALSRSTWAPRLLSFARRVSTLAFVLLVMLLVGLNLKTMAGTLGSFAIGTFALHVLVMVGVGHRACVAAHSRQGHARKGNRQITE